MIKLSKRDWVFVAMLVALPVAAWLMIFRPQSAQMEQARTRIAAREAELAKMSLATDEMARLNDEIQRCEEALGYFRSRLPQEKEMDEVLREIWRLAEDNNLETISIRAVGSRRSTTAPAVSRAKTPAAKAAAAKAAAAAAAANTFASQEVALQLEGSFDPGFFNFLTQLENSRRITRVGDMDIRTLSGRSPGTTEISLAMKVYYEK